MDTVTQMLFGATVAQAGYRRSLGRGAVLAGAAVGLAPDLDVAAGWIGGPFANWLHHRGVTHSILFAPLVGSVAGLCLLAWRRGRPPPSPGRDPAMAWIGLIVVVLATHPIIDLFTAYGTQLLAPLSRERFAINAMPIIDPVYSLPLFVSLLVGLLVKARIGLARTVAIGALFFVAGYTLFGWSLNAQVERAARLQAPPDARVTAYPTLFQPYYRRVVVETPDDLRVGFLSVLDPQPIAWTSVARGPAPRVVADTPEARVFQWFAMGKVLWTVTDRPDGSRLVEARDYRYGMPGETAFGLWGLRATLDPAGVLTGGVEAFTLRPKSDRDRWTAFLDDVF